MSAVVVTGTSKGLGLATAERLLSENYEVIGISRTDCPNKAVQNFRCDVADYDGLKAIAVEVRKNNDVIGLINASGIASMNLAFSTPKEVVQKIINVNLLGVIYCCQVFGKLLARNKFGSIVNFSTIAVKIGLKGESVYVASKAGVEGFTRSFAREMADFNVTVNAISPGPIDTNLIKNVPEEQIAEIVNQQIMPSKAKPSDVTDIVSLLLSEKARKITGQVVHVGGA